jgi:glycine/D-amino acid oxidase-like deaminating enzyme/nitrite reductase/ring-hydroxylating ferredoxin subunit
MSTNGKYGISPWRESLAEENLPALTRDLEVDVCIVGAGIAGLTTAYLLALEGQNVAVLDAGRPGAGETGYTTAHLANAIDDRYFEMERIHGAEGARLAADSHTTAIAQIESIAATEGIDCDFQRLDGYLFGPPEGQNSDLLDRELVAARRAGLTDVQWLPRAPLPHFDTGPCLRFPRQGQFHPLRYLAGLVRALQQKGAQIFSATHAESVQGGVPARVRTQTGAVVTASAVVVATNTPINDRVAIHTKQSAYRSYVIGARIPRGSVQRALYWDMLDPYHYVRLQDPPEGGNDGAATDWELLIVGGEDHKTGQVKDPGERHDRLERWARQRFPQMQDIVYRWSGQILETIDGLAFIGRNPLDAENVFIATGDSGMGMTHGTIAGILLTDLILGQENRWASLYNPARKRVHAVGEFAKENLNVAWQYADWLTPGEVRETEAIAPGSGAVIRRGLRKVAIYRSEDGETHEFSAVCPHLGCVVHWNPAEHSWDCPCHGSRFNCHGEVINGPANSNLAAVEPAKETASAR